MTTGPGSLVVRPRRLVLVCRAAALLLVTVFAVLAVLLPRGEAAGQVFALPDQLAFFGIGLLLAAAVLQLTRVRVRADAWGVRVRNYVGETALPWEVVAAVRMDEGSPWASLDLHDDDTVALLAIQANDRSHAVDAVLALRRMLADATTSPPIGGLTGQKDEDSQH